jgi:hypothetical protein
MVMSRDQNLGRRHNIQIGHSTFEIVEQVKYLEQHQQIKILCRKKLRADWIQAMLAIIRCIIFVVQFAIKKIER